MFFFHGDAKHLNYWVTCTLWQHFNGLFLYTLQLNLNFPHSAFAETSYRVHIKMTLLRRKWILPSVRYVWKHGDEITNETLTQNPTWCSNQDRTWKNNRMSLILVNLWNHWKHAVYWDVIILLYISKFHTQQFI